MTTQDETPAELQKHIRVHADGVDEPLFFEPGTPDDVIDRAVQDAQREATTATDAADKHAMFEHAPEQLAAAGGLAGAMLGGASPVPGGAMLGSALGATGGYYGGKLAQDFANQIEPTIGRIGDNLVDAVKTGVFSGIGEGVAPHIGAAFGAVKNTVLNLGAKLGNKLFVPKPTSELAKTSEKTLEQAGAPGLTLGQLYDDPAAKHAANIMETLAYNAMTTRVVNNVRNRQIQGLKDHISATMEQWNRLPHEDAVETIGAMIKDNFKTLVDAPMTVAMQDLRTQLPGRIVELRPVLREVTHPNASVINNGVRGILKRERGRDPDTYDALLQFMEPVTGAAATQARPKLTLDQAMRLKSAFESYGRRTATDGPTKDAILDARFKGEQIGNAIKASLQGTPSLLRSYESSQAMYAEGVQLYKNQILKDVFATWEKEPGQFASVFLNPQKPGIAKAMREAVGEQVWQKVVEPKLGAHLLMDAFGENMTGPLSGTALANRVQSLAVNGTMNTAFTPGMYKRLLSLAETIEHVTPTPKGAGSVLVQLSQAGAIGAVPGVAQGIATGDWAEGAKTGAGVATTVLLAPRILGKLVADPRYTEAFKKGLITSNQQKKPSSHLIQALRQLGIAETTQHTLLDKDTPTDTTKPVDVPRQPTQE